MTRDSLVKSTDGGKLWQDLEEINVQSNSAWETRLEKRAHEEDYGHRSACTTRPVYSLSFLRRQRLVYVWAARSQPWRGLDLFITRKSQGRKKDNQINVENFPPQHFRIIVYVPLPARRPPNPPDPRVKTVDWFSKITVPVFLSLVVTWIVTAAALPLSRTSIILHLHVSPCTRGVVLTI